MKNSINNSGINERLWPLPNAFNIREGSPFGRDEKFIEDAQRSERSRRSVVKSPRVAKLFKAELTPFTQRDQERK